MIIDEQIVYLCILLCAAMQAEVYTLATAYLGGFTNKCCLLWNLTQQAERKKTLKSLVGGPVQTIPC